MQKAEHEIRSAEQVRRILAEAKVLRLAMVDPQGQPYLTPVYFGTADDRLYVHCAPEGRRNEALRANPTVWFEATLDEAIVPHAKPCGFSNTYRCAMGRGVVRFVEDEEEKRLALDSLMSKFAEGPFEYVPEVLARTTVLCIEIDPATLTGKQAEPWVPPELG